MCSAGWWGLSTLKAGPSCVDGVQYGRLGRGRRGARARGAGVISTGWQATSYFFTKILFIRGFLTQGRRPAVHSRPYGLFLN